MPLITGHDVGKNYGAHEVFRGLAFGLDVGERIGLVGPNGEGKTTLLKMIAGLEGVTHGEIQFRKGTRLGYLPQVPAPYDAEVSLWDDLFAVFEPLRRRETEIHSLADELARVPSGDAHDRLLAKLSRLQEEFEHQGGYAWENRIKMVLTGLGFKAEEYGKPLGQLSGGQRTRALLARLLLEEPDVLLLDEPTNHLDLEAVEWLENYLAGFCGTLMVVSHDRYFLDKVSAGIWELAWGQLETYGGNYSHYLQQRAERRAERLAQWESQQAYVERTLDFVRRFGAGQRSKEARGRLSHLNRFLATEAAEKPRSDERIKVRIRDAGWGGDRLFRADKLTVGYVPEKPLLHVERLELYPRQRVALIGANGSGKTTLVRTLLGEIPPLAGEVRRSPGAKVGYLSQTHAGLNPEVLVVDAVRAVRPALKEEQVRTYLGNFLFRENEVFKKIGDLSGGERSRVALACLALSDVNVLLLDEPTNHLDIPSQEVLQDVLRDFSGAVLFVSHDRYLVDALAGDLWILTNGTLKTLPGNWSKYLEVRRRQSETKIEQTGKGNDSEKGRGIDDGQKAREEAKREKRRLARLQVRHEEIEKDIHALEGRQALLSAKINEAGVAGNHELVRKVGEEYQVDDERLKGLWEEWTRIGEELERKE
jgi:ATP-binding cassette subfamily F protein 3